MLNDLSARVIPHDLAYQQAKFDSAQAVLVRFYQQSPEQVVLCLAQYGPVVGHVPTSLNSSIIVYAAVEAAHKNKQQLFLYPPLKIRVHIRTAEGPIHLATHWTCTRQLWHGWNRARFHGASPSAADPHFSGPYSPGLDHQLRRTVYFRHRLP